MFRYVFFLMYRPPPRSPLFPYTTLFRSRDMRLVAVPRLAPAMAGPFGLLVLQTGRGDLAGVDQRSGPDRHALSVELIRHGDRKSTRLNSSHANISYAVFCLKK